MQIITDVRTVRLRRPTALTIGNFDGIHRGHQALLREVRRAAATLDGGSPVTTALLTFDPHPLTVLRPDIVHRVLTSPLERLHLAGALGIDLGIVQPFTPATAALDPAAFMGWMKTHLDLTALVVGPDFALGRNRSGNLDVLAALGDELGYRLLVIEPVEFQDKSVRSSNIRRLLVEGHVAQAAELLGRPYHVTGTVMRGDQRGRTIGVPTANLQPAPDKLWPADGVYATRTWVHAGGAPRVYNSVTNLGVRPTVDGAHHRFETHLLDFPPAAVEELLLPDGELYGQTLTVEFVQWLRSEKRFAGLHELVAQIQTDIATTGDLLEPPSAEPAPFFVAAQIA
jgi:riboflavin kinase/FMN adenylyltransferase